jgi:beta-glucosidase/6-phospho-beta-glucosidase/beta-galactosidase
MRRKQNGTWLAFKRQLRYFKNADAFPQRHADVSPADMNPPSPSSAAASPFAASPYRSFWMGGFEGADHVNSHGHALDMALATGHIAQLDADYALASSFGLNTVRESIGWRLAEPQPGHFDLTRAVRIAQAAQQQGLQVVWTFMHYGTPADVSLRDDAFVDRFASYCAAVAERLAPLTAAAPVYNLINEISFLSWAVSATPRARDVKKGFSMSGMTSATTSESCRRSVRATRLGV